MEAWEHIHWYLTSRCNLSCSYCFKEDGCGSIESSSRLERLASLLIDGGVRHVTLGGGEPTMVDGLSGLLKMFHGAGVSVSLHTNGLLLDDRRIADLAGLVDDIALPIDSIDESTQEQLRGKKFLKTFRRLPKLAASLSDAGIDLGYHTVFTALNSKDIPAIYRRINNADFSYWRIYEFNDALAAHRILILGDTLRVKRQRRLAGSLLIIAALVASGTAERGYTDSLYARFLLMDESLARYDDPRIQFVGIRDSPKKPYLFLDNTGNVSFYTWFSGSERRLMGNILDGGFAGMKKNVLRLERDVWGYDLHSNDEFISALNAAPLWTGRLFDGAYDLEEIEAITPKYLAKVKRLVELHSRRNKQ